MSARAVNTSKSRYDEGCAAAFTLGIVGDRWALLVVRELMFCAKRFQQIRAGVPGITPSVLTQRLTQLGEAGVIDHDAALGVYALTEAGRDLGPILHELGRWGAGRPGHDPRKFLSPTALMLSLSVMVNREAAAHFAGTVGFDLGAEQFTVSFDRLGEPLVRAVRQASGDCIFAGAPNKVVAALYGPLAVPQVVELNLVQVSGDQRSASNFLNLFPSLPMPSPASG